MEVANPLAISAVEYPCEAEVATVRRIACPRTESPVQSGIEWNEGWSWPLVGVASELPFRAPEALPLPIHDSEPECCPGPGREADARDSRVVAGGEKPELGNEVLTEVFGVVEAELEA